MYQAPNLNLWKGRKSPGSKLYHEVIEPLDLTNDPWTLFTQKNFAFLGYCCDEGVRRNMGRIGAQFAPDEIRKVVSNLAVHHDESEIGIVDAGNVLCQSQNMEATSRLLQSKIEILLNYGFFPIVLGGGHETAYPHFSACRRFADTDESVGILNFDAHFDLRTYEHGPHSGSSFLQILNDARDQNFEFLYLPVGIRPESNLKSMFDTMREAEQNYITLEEVQAGLSQSIQSISDFVSRVDRLYVTIDMDCFPAAYAPGVSAAAPDGLLPGQLKAMLLPVFRSEKVLSLDIVETNPTYDDGRTIKLVSHLIFHIISDLIKN